MPHPEQTSTPASSPDGEVATTNWPMPVFQPAERAANPPEGSHLHAINSAIARATEARA